MRFMKRTRGQHNQDKINHLVCELLRADKNLSRKEARLQARKILKDRAAAARFGSAVQPAPENSAEADGPKTA